jgi:mediator of DNA damage checkpoint protein 1
MKRRDACKGKLFAGHTFFVTPGVKDALAVLRMAIQANGGKVSMQTPTARILDGDEHKHVVSCEADIKVWKPLVQQKYPIFNKEFVLISASTQQMDVEDKSQRVPGSYLG